MHKQYRHLSRFECGKIMFLKMWHLNVSQFALRLGRDRSTISRELRRNVSPGHVPCSVEIGSGPHTTLDNLACFVNLCL